MKNFKNTFAVTGSVAQLNAFEEFARSIGWRWSEQNNGIRNGKYLLFQGKIKYSAVTNDTFCNITAIGDSIINFTLPQEWKEAMKHANEIELSLLEKICQLRAKEEHDFNHVSYMSGYAEGKSDTIKLLKTEGIINE